MLSRLASSITGTTQSSYPSTILTVEAFPEICALHIVPEDGAVEFIKYSKQQKFNHGGAKEQSREQLGTVCLRSDGGDGLQSFLDDVSQRVKRDLSAKEQPNNGDYSSQGVDQTLRSAALSTMHERATQDLVTTAAQSYPVFLIQVGRAKPGKIVGEPKSIAGW